MSKKKSAFRETFASFIIGLLIIAFMVTGYQSVGPSRDTVATVDGTPIKVREYEFEFRRSMEFYQRIMNGGKPLSQKQIEQLGLRRQALESIVRRTLVQNLASDLSLEPSSAQVAKFIQDLEMFQTNEQFDINKYKLILARNNLTPSEYEENIASSIKVESFKNILNAALVSKTFAEEVLKLEENQVSLTGVRIVKDKLQEFIEVPSKEISAFIANPENKGKIETLFQSKKRELDQQEEVKASHILIRTSEENPEDKVKKEMADIKKKLTKRNFAKLADKHTEDPSGKGKGGELGWFGKGRMVPEFEQIAFSLKPGQISEPFKTQFGYHIVMVHDKKEEKIAKIEDHRKDIARELIQRTKTKEKQELLSQIVNQVTKHLEKNNLSALKRYAKKYDLVFGEEITVNQLSRNVPVLSLEQKNLSGLFANASNLNKIQSEDSPTSLVIFKAQKSEEKKQSDDEKEGRTIEEVFTEYSNQYSNKYNQDIVKQLRSTAKVKDYLL